MMARWFLLVAALTFSLGLVGCGDEEKCPTPLVSEGGKCLLPPADTKGVDFYVPTYEDTVTVDTAPSADTVGDAAAETSGEVADSTVGDVTTGLDTVASDATTADTSTDTADTPTDADGAPTDADGADASAQ